MDKLPEAERIRISKLSEKSLLKHLVEEAGWEDTSLEGMSRTERLDVWAQFSIVKILCAVCDVANDALILSRKAVEDLWNAKVDKIRYDLITDELNEIVDTDSENVTKTSEDGHEYGRQTHSGSLSISASRSQGGQKLGHRDQTRVPRATSCPGKAQAKNNVKNQAHEINEPDHSPGEIQNPQIGQKPVSGRKVERQHDTSTRVSDVTPLPEEVTDKSEALRQDQK